MPSDNEQKVKWQFRSAALDIMTPFEKHGLNVFIEPTIAALWKLALKVHKRLNGADIPIILTHDERYKSDD